MICKWCGTAIPPDTFCPSCGKEQEVFEDGNGYDNPAIDIDELYYRTKEVELNRSNKMKEQPARHQEKEFDNQMSKKENNKNYAIEISLVVLLVISILLNVLQLKKTINLQNTLDAIDGQVSDLTNTVSNIELQNDALMEQLKSQAILLQEMDASMSAHDSISEGIIEMESSEEEIQEEEMTENIDSAEVTLKNESNNVDKKDEAIKKTAGVENVVKEKASQNDKPSSIEIPEGTHGSDAEDEKR